MMTPYSPIFALVVVATLCTGFFFLLGKVRQASVAEKAKSEAYLCGESQEALGAASKGSFLHPEYRMFAATAFLFTIVEMGALLLGTVPAGTGRLLPVAFLSLMLVSVSAILLEVLRGS